MIVDCSDLPFTLCQFRILWLSMPALKYPLATRSWAQDERNSIELRFPSGKLIASFPLAFVRDGGDNTWEFVEPTPDLPGTITDVEGVAVSLDDAPHAGSFVYTHLGLSLFYRRTFRLNLI
jgi:hypothetical protein